MLIPNVCYDVFHFRYIFFADVSCCIWRSNMDGSDPQIIIMGGVSEVTDLAMDYNTSMLYWVDSGVIHSSDYNGQGKTILSVVNTSIPSGVSVNDGTLYWTQKRTEEANGAIYSYLLQGGVGGAEVIGNNSSLNPNDISAFVSKEVIASGVCVCVCVYIHSTCTIMCPICLCVLIVDLRSLILAFCLCIFMYQEL